MSILSRFAFLSIGLLLASPALGDLTLIDLGTLPGGTHGDAYAINASGVVVGTSTTSTATSPTHAFSYSGGVTTDLGTLGGANSTAFGVNSLGQVVGSSATTGTSPVHAFLSSGGAMTDLGTLGGITSVGEGINSSGKVVGYSSIASGTLQAFSYMTSGGLVNIGGGTGTSYAYAIADSGQVAGASTFAVGAGTQLHAASFVNGGIADLGVLGGTAGSTTSQARAISSSGEIVGYSTTNVAAATHAFAYTMTGGMVDLGTLGGANSFGYGVNSAGTVVGSSAYMAGNFTIHAFADNSSLGGMVDLNTVLASTTSDFTTLTSAQGIDDKGDIIGYGITSSGQTDSFLLTGFGPSVVPEPGSWLMASMGLASAVATRRLSRKRRSGR